MSGTEPQHAATGIISRNRLECLFDGIFAIAMTILVLELKVPDLKDHQSTVELARKLAAYGPAKQLAGGQEVGGAQAGGHAGRLPAYQAAGVAQLHRGLLAFRPECVSAADRLTQGGTATAISLSWRRWPPRLQPHHRGGAFPR